LMLGPKHEAAPLRTLPVPFPTPTGGAAPAAAAAPSAAAAASGPSDAAAATGWHAAPRLIPLILAVGRGHWSPLLIPRPAAVFLALRRPHTAAAAAAWRGPVIPIVPAVNAAV